MENIHAVYILSGNIDTEIGTCYPFQFTVFTSNPVIKIILMIRCEFIGLIV